MLDIRSFKITPHNPDILNTIRIPLTYDPNAKCPKIEKFFREVLKGKDITIIQELFGYVLIPDYRILYDKEFSAM